MHECMMGWTQPSEKLKRVIKVTDGAGRGAAWGGFSLLLSLIRQTTGGCGDGMGERTEEEEKQRRAGRLEKNKRNQCQVTRSGFCCCDCSWNSIV